MSYPTQIWLGKSKFNIEIFERIKNNPFCNKPFGGLWTSTHGGKNGWDEFLIEEYDRTIKQFHQHIIEFYNDINVYEIDSLNDLKRLFGEYQLDFEKMSRIYDGVHLTAKGQCDTRMSNPNLHGWDVECTLWLRNDVFKSVEKI